MRNTAAAQEGMNFSDWFEAPATAPGQSTPDCRWGSFAKLVLRIKHEVFGSQPTRIEVEQSNSGLFHRTRPNRRKPSLRQPSRIFDRFAARDARP
jgi:hypothetical protein